MSDKKNKTARIDMRVVPELNERVKELAENLGISRNEAIERAINNYVLDKDIFVFCPDCGLPVFEKERMPIWEGVEAIECRKGHKNLYDFEKEKFVTH